MRPAFPLRSLAGSALTALFLTSSLAAHTDTSLPPRAEPVAFIAPIGVSTGGIATGMATRGLIATHLAKSGRVLPTAAAHAESASATPAGLPDRVDLSASAPPVGDQGALGSCASWSFGYYLRGYYAIRDGYYPGGSNEAGESGFAAGYLYSQLAAGNPDAATSAEQNVDLLTTQGIVANADFSQGNDQVAIVPTAAQIALAARYRIAGHQFIQAAPGANRAQIESLLAGGSPVVLNIALPDGFYGLDGDSYLFNGPSAATDPSHDIAAFGYDSAGVWVENSWGTGWGKDGWAELGWDWLETDGLRFIDTITPVTPAPLPGDASTSGGTQSSPVPAATPNPPVSIGDPGTITPIGSSASAGGPVPQGAAAPTTPTTDAHPTPAVRQLGLAVRPNGAYSARWITDVPTSGQVFWRDATGQTHSAPLNHLATIAHIVSLPGLIRGQAYVLWVRSISADGRVAQSAPLRFVAP